MPISQAIKFYLRVTLCRWVRWWLPKSQIHMEMFAISIFPRNIGMYSWDPPYMPMGGVYGDEFSSWYFWRNQPCRWIWFKIMVPAKCVNRTKIYMTRQEILSKFGTLILWPTKKLPDVFPPSWGWGCFFARRCRNAKLITPRMLRMHQRKRSLLLYHGLIYF